MPQTPSGDERSDLDKLLLKLGTPLPKYEETDLPVEGLEDEHTFGDEVLDTPLAHGDRLGMGDVTPSLRIPVRRFHIPSSQVNLRYASVPPSTRSVSPTTRPHSTQSFY